ncbi:hypothetical protein [Paraburkholderia sp. J8-2]|uniref:hypothetical protein n=1 Tax=Paraburkholderia sp. J8-2 TaxID=2805440 RepID=UPI002AB7A502|nr:hypothetical protein [Paraburkholderia sp. J8-2]
MRLNVRKISLWSSMALALWALVTAGDSGLSVETTVILLGCVTVLHLLVMSSLSWSVLRKNLPARRGVAEGVLRIALRPWFFGAGVALCGLATLMQYDWLPAPQEVTISAWVAIRIVTALAIMISHGYYTILTFCLVVPPEELK